MQQSIAARLQHYLEAWEGRAFDWGAASCCTFVAGWVHACCGRDPLAGVPAVANEREALRLLRGRFGGSLRSACAEQLGTECVGPALARVGDVAFVSIGATGAVGICAGRTVALLQIDGAIVHVPIAEALCAWRLPC